MSPPEAKKLWEFRIKPSRATGTFEGEDPVFHEDLVGLPTEGLLAFHALDLRTGRLRWTFELRKMEKPGDALLAHSALVPVAGGWLALCEGKSNYHVVPLSARKGPGPARAVPLDEAGDATLCAADGDSIVHFVGDRMLGTFDVKKGRWIRWTPAVPWSSAPPRRDPRGYVLNGNLVTFETPTPKGTTRHVVFRDPKTGRELKSLDLQSGCDTREIRIWKDRMLVPLRGQELVAVDTRSMSARPVPLDPKLGRETALLGETLFWIVGPPIDPVPAPLLCSLDLKTLTPGSPRPLTVPTVPSLAAWNGGLLLAAGRLMRCAPATGALTELFKSKGWLGCRAAGSVALRYASTKAYDAWPLPD